MLDEVDILSITFQNRQADSNTVPHSGYNFTTSV
jgi:hypothetical protein